MEQYQETNVGLCRVIKMEKMKIIGTMSISVHLNGAIFRIFSKIQVNMVCLCGLILNTLVHNHSVHMG